MKSIGFRVTVVVFLLWVLQFCTGQYLKQHVYYINSLQISNGSNCGNLTNPCPTVQHALVNFSSEYSELIQNLPSNSSLTFQISFIMLNTETDFCGYNLLTPIKENIEYELNFLTTGQEMIKIMCTKGYGELNFIEERLDVSSLSFSQLMLEGVVYKSCSGASLSLSNCVLVNGGFIISPKYQTVECTKEISNRTSGNLYISNTSTYHGIIFYGNAKNGIMESCLLDGISGISLNDMESLEIRNVRVVGDGMFSSRNVNFIIFKNFISTSKTFTTNVREFVSFRMESSSYENYNYFTSAINIDRGESAVIIDTSVHYSTQWLGVKTVKKLILSNIKLTSNRVLDVRTSHLCSIFIYSCDSVNIENSYFDGNNGIKAGVIFIDDFKNVLVSNNTFLNGRSESSGGAIYMGNYQAESLLDRGLVYIRNNLFRNNSCANVGGAIFIASAVDCQVIGNQFIQNQANNLGGAFGLLDHCRNCLINSHFEENQCTGKVFNLNSLKLSQDLSNIAIGSGGAIAIFNDPRFPFRIDGSKFVRNYGAKGGAILMGSNAALNLANSWSYVSNCEFEGNRARMTGDDVYTVNYQVPKEFIGSFINQTAGSENSFSSTPSIFRIDKVSSTKVFPGQSITVTFYLENIFGKEINMSSQYTVTDQYSNLFPSLNYAKSDSKSLVVQTFATTNQFSNSSTFNFTFYSEDRRVSATFLFEMLPCPKKYILSSTVVNSNEVFHCTPEAFDLDLILGITIPIGIFVLVIGIILGGLSVYVIRFLIRQVATLRKKQKAEKTLEMRIIDKKIIFNHSDTSITSPSTNYTRYTNKSSDLSVPLIESGAEKLPSFIIPIESIEIIKKLAEGGLGIIYLGKLWKKIDVAIKLLKSEEQDEEFEQEVSLLSSLRHDNIVTFYGICMSDDAKYMITEFVEMGSLDKALYKARLGESIMTLEKKMSILIATARGIDYLHGLTPTVVHRDLKPGNILLDEARHAKICDFGISRTVSNSTAQQTAMTTNLGTLIYCPNEVIEGPTLVNKASKQTATKIDIYSFSIILWEVFFEVTPYSPSSGKLTPLYQVPKEESEILNMNSFNIPYFVTKGLRPIIPFKTDEQIKEWVGRYMPKYIYNSNIVPFVRRYFDLVQECWSSDATKRPTIMEVLQELEDLNNLIK